MTSGPTHSGGVGQLHEQRRVELETFAHHLGFSLRFPYPDGSRPDVTLIHPDRRALFVGDAKHTERPTSRATRARLSAYCSWLGFAPGEKLDLFAIACLTGVGPCWSRVLVELIGDAGLISNRPWVRPLSRYTELTLVGVRRPTLDSNNHRTV